MIFIIASLWALVLRLCCPLVSPNQLRQNYPPLKNLFKRHFIPIQYPARNNTSRLLLCFSNVWLGTILLQYSIVLNVRHMAIGTGRNYIQIIQVTNTLNST